MHGAPGWSLRPPEQARLMLPRFQSWEPEAQRGWVEDSAAQLPGLDQAPRGAMHTQERRCSPHTSQLGSWDTSGQTGHGGANACACPSRNSSSTLPRLLCIPTPSHSVLRGEWGPARVASSNSLPDQAEALDVPVFSPGFTVITEITSP